MKVLITTDLYTTDTNGVVTSVKNLTEELVTRGHDVRILTFSDGGHSYRIGNVFYIRSLPLGAIYPDVRMPTSYRHRLIKQIIDWKPDIIHSQCEFFSFQYAQRISKLTGAPVVHTYHTLYEQYASYVMPIKSVGEKAVGKLSKFRLKNVQCIFAPTRKVENVLRSYGIDVPIRVIPSGIRLEQHKKRLTPQQRAEKRRELGIGEDTVVMISIGRLGKEKNLDEPIRYFAEKVSPDRDVRFLIVGDGPAREGLQKLAQELGVEGRVIFTGMIPPTQVQEYYQLGDLFVSASTSETQGLTYVEAAANGLPLLCRRDPCLQDVLRWGENGYDFENAQEFADNLEKILSDPAWRHDAGKCSEELSAAFGTDVFGRSVEQAYRSVLDLVSKEAAV